MATTSFNVCGLTTVPASGLIRIGDIRVGTPDLKSISVSRTRGQLVSSCSVSFIFNGEFSAPAGAPIAVFLYDQSVWVGVVKRLSISPSLRCAGSVLVKIQAEDILHKLENRSITRRQKLAGLGPMAFITSVHKRTSPGFDDPPSRHNIFNSASEVGYLTHTINFREHTQFGIGNENTTGSLHPWTKIADPINNAGQSLGAGGGGSGFILHDHSSLDISGPHAGGPSYSVFGVK